MHLIYLLLEKQKTGLPSCHINDVAFGSPAIFQKEEALNQRQRGLLRPVAFRLPITRDLALVQTLNKKFEVHVSCPLLKGNRLTY